MMDTVYIRYFGEILKFSLEDYRKFIRHLINFRQMEAIKNVYPPDTIAWLMDEFGIEEVDYPMDAAGRTFIDHRNDSNYVTLSPEEFEQLRNDRIAELSKTQQKKFKQEESLAFNNQPMLQYLGLELLAELNPKRTINLKLPCNDDLEVDYKDMKNLGYIVGDRHTEKMARRIQFWRTYALSLAPDDRKVKQQQKHKKRESILHGKKRIRSFKNKITPVILDTAIKSAIKKIKLPSSINIFLNKTVVFDAVADEVKVLTGKSPSTLGNWMRENKISRDYIYGNMPDHIQSRMKK